jgi:hypothetical protein
MAISSTCYPTIDNPIPEWKGTTQGTWRGVAMLPDILTISGDPPPISGAANDIIDFHCAETFDKDGGISNVSVDPDVVKYELVTGTKYDDQS